MGVGRDGRPGCLVVDSRDSSGANVRLGSLRCTLWRDLGVDAVFSQDQFLYIIGSTDSPSLLSTTTLGNDDLLILRLN